VTRTSDLNTIAKVERRGMTKGRNAYVLRRISRIRIHGVGSIVADGYIVADWSSLQVSDVLLKKQFVPVRSAICGGDLN
jgi:hypothetical protein